MMTSGNIGVGRRVYHRKLLPRVVALQEGTEDLEDLIYSERPNVMYRFPSAGPEYAKGLPPVSPQLSADYAGQLLDRLREELGVRVQGEKPTKASILEGIDSVLKGLERPEPRSRGRQRRPPWEDYELGYGQKQGEPVFMRPPKWLYLQDGTEAVASPLPTPTPESLPPGRKKPFHRYQEDYDLRPTYMIQRMREIRDLLMGRVGGKTLREVLGYQRGEEKVPEPPDYGPPGWAAKEAAGLYDPGETLAQKVRHGKLQVAMPVVAGNLGRGDATGTGIIEVDGRWYIVPRERLWTDEDTREHFNATGEHFGVFNAEDDASIYEQGVLGNVGDDEQGHYARGAFVPSNAGQSTDTVPAFLTPKEAVLNRNAAELVGRDKIAALNRAGNQLANAGVDLPSGKIRQDKTRKGKAMKKMKRLQAGTADLTQLKKPFFPNLPAPDGGPDYGGGVPMPWWLPPIDPAQTPPLGGGPPTVPPGYNVRPEPQQRGRMTPPARPEITPAQQAALLRLGPGYNALGMQNAAPAATAGATPSQRDWSQIQAMFPNAGMNTGIGSGFMPQLPRNPMQSPAFPTPQLPQSGLVPRPPVPNPAAIPPGLFDTNPRTYQYGETDVEPPTIGDNFWTPPEGSPQVQVYGGGNIPAPPGAGNLVPPPAVPSVPFQIPPLPWWVNFIPGGGYATAGRSLFNLGSGAGSALKNLFQKFGAGGGLGGGGGKPAAAGGGSMINTKFGPLEGVKVTGKTPAPEYYSPEYLESIGYREGQGTGSLWPGTGPSVGSYDVGAYGVGGEGGSFFHGNTPGGRFFPLPGSMSGLGSFDTGFLPPAWQTFRGVHSPGFRNWAVQHGMTPHQLAKQRVYGGKTGRGSQAAGVFTTRGLKSSE